ncbi:MAG: hypothetical protein AAF674_12950 [Pseudomonadota bacterium]
MSDTLDRAADEIERLQEKLAEAEAALDAAEQDIGSPWRFWARKCRDMAQTGRFVSVPSTHTKEDSNG